MHFSGSSRHRPKIIFWTLSHGMFTTYKTHRRVNAPIEFHGFKAQYILYAGGCVISNMVLFALLYIIGASSWICLLLCFGLATLGIYITQRFSHRYGQYGCRKHQKPKKLTKV